MMPGFSMFNNKEDAIEWAKWKAAERSKKPVVLETSHSKLEKVGIKPYSGAYTDANEARILLKDYKKVTSENAKKIFSIITGF